NLSRLPGREPILVTERGRRGHAQTRGPPPVAPTISFCNRALAALAELPRALVGLRSPHRAYRRRLRSRDRYGLSSRAEVFGPDPPLRVGGDRVAAVAGGRTATRPPGEDLHLGPVGPPLRPGPPDVVGQYQAVARVVGGVHEHAPTNREHWHMAPARRGIQTWSAGRSKHHCFRNRRGACLEPREAIWAALSSPAGRLSTAVGLPLRTR